MLAPLRHLFPRDRGVARHRPLSGSAASSGLIGGAAAALASLAKVSLAGYIGTIALGVNRALALHAA